MVASEEDDERMVAAEASSSLRLAGIQKEHATAAGHRADDTRAVLCNGSADDGGLFSCFLHRAAGDSVFGGSRFIPGKMDHADGGHECVGAANGIETVQYVQHPVVRHDPAAGVGMDAGGSETGRQQMVTNKYV